ncbi:hypothetical protein GGR57DRAFT_455590 [Xylariaceae sp. FL1272]|nr:hypothetical protein GGR57DRAFT_455590 [Xylariaceae sp. FL1272]
MLGTKDPKSLLNQPYTEAFEFPQFTQLPWELRNQIWTSALQRKRLVRISLKEFQPKNLTKQESSQVRYGSASLFVNGFQLLSKLLRVNSEARTATLEFYHLKLPCILVNPGGEDSAARLGVLPFNPVYDCLWVEKSRRLHPLCELLQASIANDKHQIGVRSMALSINDDMELFRGLHAEDNTIPQYDSAICKNIREIHFVTEVSSYGAQLAKERYNDDRHRNTPAQSSRPFAHRRKISQEYAPLSSGIPSFELLAHDPRPIKDDIARLFLGHTNISGSIFRATRRLSSHYGLDASNVSSYVLFMCRDENLGVQAPHSPHDAPFVHRKRLSASKPKVSELVSRVTPNSHLTSDEETQGEETCAVVGFWLFPLSAFHRYNNLPHPIGSLRVWDMSESWPQLGLFHLPADTSSNRGCAVER